MRRKISYATRSVTALFQFRLSLKVVVKITLTIGLSVQKTRVVFKVFEEVLSVTPMESAIHIWRIYVPRLKTAFVFHNRYKFGVV